MTTDRPGTIATAAADRVEPIDLRDSPALVPPRGHYSHVAVHAGVAYISGQLPLDASGTPLADQPFDVQVAQVLDNLDQCLRTAASSRDQLLSVTVYVTDIAQWPAFDSAYAEWVGTHRPARAVACVAELHYGAALEVMAVAAVAPAATAR
jgi:enamine deaminase RidA (YjgF/YER057c/UK114 family)